MTVQYRNRLNGDLWQCEDTRAIKEIDGVKYIAVHRTGNPRPQLMRLDALEKVKLAKTKSK